METKKTVDTSSLNQLIKKTEKDLRLEKQPNYNPDKDPNLLRRIKYLTETYDGVNLGTEYDKAIAQEDRELAKLGRNPKNILQRDYPKKQATPKQVEFLKKNFYKMKANAEGDRKVRKYIVNQLKSKAKIPEFNLNIEPIVKVAPPVATPEQIEAERRFNELVEQDKQEKLKNRTSGIAGLLGI